MGNGVRRVSAVNRLSGLAKTAAPIQFNKHVVRSRQGTAQGQLLQDTCLLSTECVELPPALAAHVARLTHHAEEGASP